MRLMHGREIDRGRNALDEESLALLGAFFLVRKCRRFVPDDTFSVSMQHGTADMMRAYVPPLSSMRSTPAVSRRTANARESSSSKPPKKTYRQRGCYFLCANAQAKRTFREVGRVDLEGNDDYNSC